jgi:hypothetical protein
MGFDPYNRSLKISRVHREFNSQNGNSLGNVSVHSHTLPHSQASLLARALASPCLGRKPKARVATPIGLNDIQLKIKPCAQCIVHLVNNWMGNWILVII